MIVRAITMVHFRGVTELRLDGFEERGVVVPEIPPGADRTIVADALRFALLGAAGDASSVVTDGMGYAHVEVVLQAAGGTRVSVFRGVDRRGSVQVSLREEDGLRVTGGEAEVRARLEELAGATLPVWERATFIGGSPAIADPTAPAPRLAQLPRTPAAPAAESRVAAPQEIAQARERAEAAVDRLRRALRADVLRQRVESDYAALCDFGARLHREHTDVSVAADRAAAERDRIRARVRRVGEYRELVAQDRTAAQQHAPAPAPAARAAPWAERASAGCAVLLLVILVFVRSAPETAQDRGLAIVLGLGFLASAACYVAVAAASGRERSAGSAPREPARSAGDEWRDALRHRFADLGDPDDPKLLDDLRARLAPLEPEIAALQKRLEQLDEALAAFDVEAGRAAKVTHGGLTHVRAESAQGLAPGESAADASARLGKLGDAVYHAAVERDALLAGGAETADAAAEGVREAFRLLGEAAGDAAGARSALERAGLVAGTAGEAARDTDVCARLGEEVASMGRRSRRIAVRTESAPPPAALPAESPPDVATLLAGHVERISGRGFVLVQDGASLGLRFQGPGDAKPLAWAALPADVRERLEFALRLRLADAALSQGRASGRPRHIVVLDRPAAFADDAALAEFVGSVAPDVAQVIVLPASAAATETAARSAASARAAEPPPRRMTPR